MWLTCLEPLVVSGPSHNRPTIPSPLAASGRFKMSGKRSASMAIQLTLIASVLSVSASAFAQTCTASASANAGDNVTVLAILHTDDPNENGEGEPLSVTISNGGGTFLFGDYETTHSFNFQAAATAPVTVGG